MVLIGVWERMLPAFRCAAISSACDCCVGFAGLAYTFHSSKEMASPTRGNVSTRILRDLQRDKLLLCRAQAST